MKSNPYSFVLLTGLFMMFNGPTYGQLPRLKEAYQDIFYIGTALNRWQISDKDSCASGIITSQFSSITPENILKWQFVHPKPDRYDFDASDQFVALGKKNGMFIVGHALVWHAQTPRWVFQDSSGASLDREALLARMKEHILTVVGRYKGQINGWDVVNEAIEDDGQLRKSPWLNIIGEDYIQKAFEFAREADPDAELYYNDYSMYHKGRRERVVKLVRNLQDKGIRVDGIGLQAHWGLDYPSLDELETSIIAYAQTGAKVMITEMDISALPNPYDYRGADIARRFQLSPENNPYSDGLPDSMQVRLAERYKEIFALFVKHRDKISRVTLWGIHDRQSWKNNFPIRGRTDYPLLFDRECQPKKAFFSVIEAAQE